MQINDLVVVMNKDAVSGVSRPSFAKVMSVDGEKVLVESMYQGFGTAPAKWVTSSSFCLKVESDFIESVIDHKDQNEDFESGEMVMFVDKTRYDGDKVIQGVVVNVTPKTVEIMVNGSVKIQRKKKSLVMRLV
jgi:hypothetical protein